MRREKRQAADTNKTGIKRQWSFYWICIVLCAAGCSLAAGCRMGEESKLLEVQPAVTQDDFKDGSGEDTAGRTDDVDGRTIYVHVCGAVANPGVYMLDEDSRVFEAIAMAGGLLPEGDAGGLNQAERLSDGQMVRIRTKEEASQESQNPDASLDGVRDGKVDLNRATREQLMALPGIGGAKADSILSYREANGGFQTIEDLMQIEGIKEGVFNKLKDRITVNEA